MHLAYVYVYVCIKVREGGEALGREGARVVLVDLLADKDRWLFGLMKKTNTSRAVVCRVVCMCVPCRMYVCVCRVVSYICVCHARESKSKSIRALPFL